MENVGLNPHKCKHCQKLVFDLRKTREVYPSLNQSALFDVTPEELAGGAEEDCALMKWILNYINAPKHSSQPSYDGLVMKWDLSEPLPQRRNTDLVTAMGRLLGDIFGIRAFVRDLVLKMDIEDTESDISCIRDFNIWNKRTRKTGGIPNRSLFGVCTSPDNVAARHISTRPICQSVSTQAFPLARNWLKECLESHIECPKPEPSAGMPTRVIEIFEHDGELQTRLYHPAVGESQFYIALSYCWGGHQLVTTTTENKAAFAESISIQTLPKTIQDAINTAWELGIHYLWVDSLCIIQNDADDMAREIAKMPQVYGQAICTIMASRASSAQEGFLHDRIATELPHLTCELPYRCPDNQLGSIILLSQDKEFVHEPLDDRGWTLQEYLLSTRILDFGTRQTRWICPSTKNKPGYTDGWRQEPDRNNQRPGSLTIKDESFKQGDLKSKAQQLGYESVIEEWRNVLESYAARKLTVPTDRILAMSGIADRYGAMFQDNYLAGLWKFAFPFELLWMRKASQRPVPRSTKEYQAPSWSWAAITQGISFASLRWTSADSRLELLDCKIELDNQGAPYGAVRSGHLKVRGKMREASWIPVRPQADAWEPTAQALTRRGPDGLEEVLAAYILPDALEEEFSSGWVRSLPVHLLQVVHDPNDPVVGLVLRKLDVGLYSRLGIFAFSWTHFGGEGSGMGWDERNKKFEEQRNWFEDSVPEVVTIV